MDKCFVWISDTQRINLMSMEGARQEDGVIKLDVGDSYYTVLPPYVDSVLVVLNSLTDDGVRGPRR